MSKKTIQKEVLRKRVVIEIPEKLISIRKHSLIDKIVGYFGIPKFSINSIYSFLMGEFSQLHMMQYDVPIEAEGKLDSKVCPPRYFLSNGWKIKKSDLKHLYGGLLISENCNDVLVYPENILKIIYKKYKPLLVVIASIIGVLASIITIYEFLIN
jgi:hypothetical protein